MRISGRYSVTKWDEHPYQLIEERMKLTRASVEFEFNGDIEGTAFVEYLMFYTSFDAEDMHKSRAQYVGQMRIVGSIKGRYGSFVFSDVGAFEAGTANSKVKIIPQSGTEELVGISGSGTYTADQAGCSWELDIDL
jgi:hypothetical protein